MAKKKQQLVLEIFTDREWVEQIRFKEGLVLADIFSQTFGPCTAMQTGTKKYKLEHPQGDLLTLAVVAADDITFLKRFVGNSEPTFMFLVNGQMVNMYIGCNAPVLIRLLKEEFNKELRARRGEVRRKILPMDRRTPAEIDRQKRLDKTLNAERRAEEELRAAALLEIRLRYYERISEALYATTVVVFLPQSVEGGQTPEIAEILKETWRKMGIDVVREDSIIISEDMADEIFFERKLPQHRLLVEVLRSGRNVAMMLKKVRPGEGEPDKGGEGDAPKEVAQETGGDTYPIDMGVIERTVAETVYGFYPVFDTESDEEAEEEMIRETVDTALGREAVEKDEEDESDDDEEEEGEVVSTSKGSSASQESELPEWIGKKQPKDLRPPENSPAGMLLRRYTKEKTILPGIYAPFTPNSKAAAVRVLFPTYVGQFYEVEPLPPEPPPCVMVAFDAAKRHEVLEIASEFPGEVLKMGFFNDKKERLGNTVEEYEKLARRGAKDTIVLAVTKTRSAPLLALSNAAPSYVSPNATIGKQDERRWFAADNLADLHKAETPPEPEEEPEPLVPPSKSLQPAASTETALDSEAVEAPGEAPAEDLAGIPAEAQPPAGTATVEEAPPAEVSVDQEGQGNAL